MKLFGCAKGAMLRLLLVLGSGFCVSAAAQEQLETVVIEGSSTCGTCVTNVSGSSPPDINMDVSRTSDADGGSGANLARKKKTPEQREEEKKRCDNTYANAKGSLDMQTQALYVACTNGEFATVEKYLEKLPIIGSGLAWLGWTGPQACMANVKKNYDDKLFNLELDRAQCKANADK
jgi:hypothetical protein